MANAPLLLEGIFAAAVLFVATGAVFPLLRRLGGEGTVTVNVGTGPEGTIYQVAFAVTALLSYRVKRDILSAVRRDIALWALPAIALLSTAWSTDPGHTLKSAILLCGCMLFGAYLAIRFGTEGHLTILALTLLLVIVLSVGSVYVPPGIGIDRGAHAGAWRGVFGHKNLFGRISALALATYAVLLLYKPALRPLALVCLAAAGPMIWLSESRTAIVVGIGILAFLAARPLLRRISIRWWLVALVLLVTLGALAAISWNQRTDLAHHATGEDTLTGRTLLWGVSLLKVAAKPVLGYGFAGFWEGRANNFMDVWNIVGWNAPNAHNAFIDIALDLGTIGLTLFTLVIVRTWTRCFALLRRSDLLAIDQVWPGVVVSFCVVAFLTEGQLMQNHVYWMLFTAAAVLANRPALPLPQSDSSNVNLPIQSS